LIGARFASAETPSAAALPTSGSTIVARLTTVGCSVAAVLTAVWDSVWTPVVATRGRFGGGELGFSSLDPWPLFAGLLTATAVVAIGGRPFEVGRIFFLLFEKISDVEESVAFESDVDKCGLHAGKNPGDTALIDGAG
jgi:hypothetical protein